MKKIIPAVGLSLITFVLPCIAMAESIHVKVINQSSQSIQGLAHGCTTYNNSNCQSFSIGGTDNFTTQSPSDITISANPELSHYDNLQVDLYLGAAGGCHVGLPNVSIMPKGTNIYLTEPQLVFATAARNGKFMCSAYSSDPHHVTVRIDDITAK